VDGDRVEHALHVGSADLTGGHRVLGKALTDVEGVTVLAAIFVDRHRRKNIAEGLGTPWA
jgi:hypothetical protein